MRIFANKLVSVRPGRIRRDAHPGIVSVLMSTPQTSTITWVDPIVSGSRLALRVLYVFENDIANDPPTQAYVGSAEPGAQTFTTGVLPAGARRTYQVQAEDVAGNRGPMSSVSTEIEAPTVPGAPTGVLAILNLP